MIKKRILLILLMTLNISLLFATSTAGFTDGSSVVFLVDDFHSAISNEISYDINDHLSNRNLVCDLMNCESNISRQKWLIESEINLNENLEYLIIMPLSYYGLEKSLQKAVEKGIHIIILENNNNFDNATKLLIPWEDATTSLFDYVAQSNFNVSNFVEIQGNLMGGLSSSISTEFKKAIQKNDWNIGGIEENSPSRQQGFENTLAIYRASLDKTSTYYFIHTMEASRGFLDASILIDQDSIKLLSLDINAVIKKAILCDYCMAGISYMRNYGELISSIIETEDARNYTYYLDYKVVSKDLLYE